MKNIKGMNPFAITLLSILLCVILSYFQVPFLDFVELKTVDLRFKSRGEVPPSGEIVIAAIDEKSLAEQGKWFWPRSKIAKLIDMLSDAGARVIGLDILFLEADNQNAMKTLNEVEKGMKTLKGDQIVFKQHVGMLKALSDHDAILESAITGSRASVVLGYFFQLNAEELGAIDPHTIDVNINNTKGSLYKWVRNKSGHTINELPLYDGLSPQSNIPIISRSTPHSGYLNMQQPVEDAVVRWVPTVVRCQENLYAPFSLKILSVYLNTNISVDLDAFGIENIRVGNINLPVDYKGRMLINYRGPEKTFPHISVTDILENRVDREQIRNKIVLIGATATGIYDLRATPFSNIFPGVEIQANIIDNILQQDFLKRPDWHEFYNLLAIIFSGAVLGFILARVRILMGVVLTLSYLICYFLFTELLFVKMGILLNIIYPFTVLVLIYIGITLYQYATVERKRAFIKKAFSTYLPHNVVEELIKTPEKLVLGGEKKEITAFFSDIEGFTPISEKLGPEALIELLNEFLTEMGDIIIANSGTVIEFPGDGIIAMFGAPISLENHEQSACNACIQMQQRLETLREKWQQEKNLTIRMRIGLCSGPAIVGNMGSKKRFSYGMVGDTVNAAARLEGVNKVYGTYTIVSGDTYNNTKDNIFARKLDTVKVVGKDKPIDIYEVIGYAEDVNKIMNTIFDLYAKGLLAYQNQNWHEAMGYFQKALEIRPQDAPSKTMYTRCKDYIVKPPPPNWDGAYVMKSK